jgi:FdhD protein
MNERRAAAGLPESPDEISSGEFLIAPSPDDPDLTRQVSGIDHEGRRKTAYVVAERPLTIFLNDQEIVTAMTVGDHPKLLAVGYLVNQAMLQHDDALSAVEYDEESEVVVVRTERATDYEEMMRHRIRTSGCAVGTVFGQVMENFEDATLDPDVRIRTSTLYTLSRKITLQPSLYLKSGAIHGCALCEGERVLLYVEDVGRHNAADKVAGWLWLNHVDASRMLLYTTGRLTSEMVIKTVQMGIPALVSRSGFTAQGVELAVQANLTLVGRVRGRRFLALAGTQRLILDVDPSEVPDDPPASIRKGAAPQ